MDIECGPSQESIRLPTAIKPVLYDIALTPDFKNFTFSGTVSIDIEILEKTDKIVLNSNELAIQSVTLKKGEKTLLPDLIEVNRKTQRAVFTFAETLPLGKAQLHIDYYGILNDQMAGFYRSFYEVNGEKRIMATTQFEDTDARLAFPCWDEPAIKAQFKVTLVVPKNLMALSNMPVVEEEINGAKKIVRFDQTPVMSTYLLAFIVGELEHIEATTKDGVLVRVFTTPGKKKYARFALDTAVKVLQFYNDYFKIPYPLPKLDLVAIPDFAAGAMENWGLDTFRETALLIDPKNSPAALKQRVAIVIAHELSHQWFGNLVTMLWWTQLWLNEGFASFMEYVAIDHIFPKWKVWESFVVHDHAQALSADALRTTHPVEVVIKDPSEIRQMFDAVSYSKGAVVVRMIHEYLGPEIFRKGIQLYLKRHAYGNATTEDLWQALEEVSGQPVKGIMDTWTKQSGYPAISFEEVRRSRDAKTAEFRIRQQRFLSSGARLLLQEEKQVWAVASPITVTDRAGQSTEPILLSDSKKVFTLPTAPGTWSRLNTGQAALVRVNYTPELWDLLNAAVSNGELDTIERYALVSDLSAFARAGMVPVTQLLELLEVFKDERAYIVCAEVLGGLGSAAVVLPDESISQKYLYAFGRDILTQIVNTLG